jgi:hypothetical protein
MGHLCLMSPRAITGFYPGDYPVNHDATNLIHHLAALTVSDPGQTKIPKDKHQPRAHTQRIGDVQVIAALVTSRCALLRQPCAPGCSNRPLCAVSA